MMTFEEARKFIAETSKTGSVLGLESICNLMGELGNIQEKLRIIHIAGTNGKGSVGAYLQAIFERAGLTTARYTSPAVFDPLEVFRYCGNNISESEYARIMSQVKRACDILVSKGKAMPTVFEVETGAAFLWFYEKKPDIVLLEVGMGGETDATNLISHPLASVITTISRDHMGFLGESLGEIARVKAGIIKSGCPVFSAPQAKEVEQVLCQCARDAGADLTFVEEENCQLQEEEPGCLRFRYKGMDYQTSMAGIYQLSNASLAIEVGAYVLNQRMIQDLKGSTAFAVEEQQAKVIQKGIAEAKWPGRFEIIDREPLFVIDGAHNEDAAKKLADTVSACFGETQLTYIIGVLADKEHEKMLKLMLPFAKKVYTVTPANPRALEGECLAQEVKKYHAYPEEVMVCDTVAEAVTNACQGEAPVLAFGSLSYLGELKAILCGL